LSAQAKQQQQQQHRDGADKSGSIGTSLSSSEPAGVLAVEEVEACSDDAYPHLLPKVQVPFITKPGETPRRVQIQR
jgi:hypothetical protein